VINLLKQDFDNLSKRRKYISSDEREVEAACSFSYVEADDPLISDASSEELEIAVESFGKGLWRFRWEPKEYVRRSEKKE
jgi:hypothetical protein